MKKAKSSNLMDICKDYNDTFTSLYTLKAYNQAEIDKIYKDIKFKFIETKLFSPFEIMTILSNAFIYNNRALKSYCALYKQIFEEYQSKEIKVVSRIMNYLIYKNFELKSIDIDKECFEEYELHHYSLEVHEKNTIFKVIMDDDKELLNKFIESEIFNVNQRLRHILYPYTENGLSLIELCCYHGAINCFNILRTKFDSEITQTCLDLSFLGGNQEIINQCLKCQDPNEQTMRYAIISHNLYFVTFLESEYNLKIDLYICYTYNNIMAFLVYLELTKKIDICFLNSPMFKIPHFTEFLLSHGADIKAVDEEENTILHNAAKCSNIEVVELIISHGFDVNALNNSMKTPLVFAIENQNIEIIKLLLSYGANVNIKDKFGRTAVLFAMQTQNAEIFSLINSHQAK
ncbi:hypothetical protein TVAG_375470 [Trichomonas vaginalis G3]|uniref:DUF3447 domain-containing protein n=1 Tax=Trichomonas vaginalis (strain ATCC PRA-98 / G3) TaxID=412133 RepID=A2G5X4_TRIV3|nr:protein ubiquitination [Trichomonas vaginalis G3]EAX87444.1 hypothetical protein TVAG_375470 [Trichomonas vaginalis G3]KAI5553772.1 protein ubiquitination [Trichomonas vaginalis G3]|eukprot:XP_001300374.1 hypothetical protein [Trichomonas vaginalis G3]